jgi:hypothetical protein
MRLGLGDQDDPRLLKPGNKLILFLKEVDEPVKLVTVDPWFGVQLYNPIMQEDLKKIVKEAVDRPPAKKP